MPSGALTLTLVRTGGFVGVNQTITIAADGSWTYVDKRAGTTSTGRLRPDQVAQLVKLLQDPSVDAVLTFVTDSTDFEVVSRSAGCCPSSRGPGPTRPRPSGG